MTVRIASLAALALALSVPALAADRQPIEPIDVPASIEQGLDMVYIDREIAPSMDARDDRLSDLGFEEWKAAPIDLFLPVHPLYTELRRALVRYRLDWAGLPQVDIPAGEVLKPGSEGERVALLRQRLGLPEGTKFDEAVAAKVKAYQQVHGLKPDGIVGAGTIGSLNLGADHFERVLILNLERARRLPRADERGRYILVDAGSARLWMYEDGKPVDSMKVIVGEKNTETPMMAALLSYVSVNPEWNVPPELAEKLVAPNVLKEGLTYLTDRDYKIYSSWDEDAVLVDPATVDWRAIAAGEPTNLRLVRGPGPWNSMGDMKFMMPNDYGIYLHDVPDAQKELFAKDDRWISNGCIRLEDAERLATWLFGKVPKGRNAKVEEDIQLPSAVPVYVTYLTAAAAADGPRFRADPYNRDPALIARYFGGEEQVASTAR
jgi:murein L,D-transpeptidase YcbB/YkuD